MKTASAEQSTADAVLDAVADEQRQAVLRTLAAADRDTLDYWTLTKRVVDRVRADDATLPLSEHRERVKISLYHTHLPKLVDCRLIVNDSDGKEVRGVIDDRTRTLLDCIEPLE